MVETLVSSRTLFDWQPDTSITADAQRRPAKSESNKAALGQFFTPSTIASFMAQQFSLEQFKNVKLLDAGAGPGALSAAFIRRWQSINPDLRLQLTAYETDSAIIPKLAKELHQFESSVIDSNILNEDFIESASKMIALGRGERFTHCILNPPYKKISSNSFHRAYLRAAGLETVNLYSGFVALALGLLESGGELVAIIPRSFCNGPYYEPFRRYILRYASIELIHLFGSRTKAFKQDSVLQENIIIKLVKGKVQSRVRISTSTDDSFSDLCVADYSFQRIVLVDDKNLFIHIPTDEHDDSLLQNEAFGFTINDLGLKVSTGPVVDFRMREHLVDKPEEGTVPLLYPGHFANQNVEWPRDSFKKPNCIRDNVLTRKSFYPNGYYTVVRRFSSKEEKRRLVASIIDPNKIPYDWIGVENHLNIIHDSRKPLTEEIARGLAVYLNSSIIEQYFRRFNGHTQVNATDLKSLPYPNLKSLIRIGRSAKMCGQMTQTEIDQLIDSLV